MALKELLFKHLLNLERLIDLRIWADHKIIPGTPWDKEIMSKLQESQVFILLISPDFVNSDFCYSKEMMGALALQKEKRAIIIPVLLTPMTFTGFPFSEFQTLPTNPVFLSDWPDKNAACANITAGVKTSIDTFIKDIVCFRKREIETLVEEGQLKQACNRLVEFSNNFAREHSHITKAKSILGSYNYLVLNNIKSFEEMSKVSMSILDHMDFVVPENTIRSAA